MSDFDFLANIPLAASNSSAAVGAATHQQQQQKRKAAQKRREIASNKVDPEDSDSSSDHPTLTPAKQKKRRQLRRRQRSELDSSDSSASSSSSEDESLDKSEDDIKLSTSLNRGTSRNTRNYESSVPNDRKRMASSETSLEKQSVKRRDKQSLSSSAQPPDDSDEEVSAEEESTQRTNDKAAALDFLRGISLGESPVNAKGKKSTASKPKPIRDSGSSNHSAASSDFIPGSYPGSLNSSKLLSIKHSTESLSGSKSSKKLAHSGKTKPKPLYNIIKGDRLGKKTVGHLVDNRFVIRSPGGFPLLVSSIIPVEKPKLKTKTTTESSIAPDGGGLVPLRILSKKVTSVSYSTLLAEKPEPYDPSFLDSDLPTPDKYKITINLPSYRESIIPWVKAGDLKKNQNTMFQEHHPWLKTNITLSKIRSVKRKIVQVAISKALDVGTAALSYVYFEKLVLKNLVTKQNYKVYGANCLLIAEKFYGTRPKSFKFVIDALEKVFKISSKEIISNEFSVYKDLSFSLFVDANEVLPHLVKLQSSQEFVDHLFEYSAQERKKTREQREQREQQALARRTKHSLDGQGMVINRFGIYGET